MDRIVLYHGSNHVIQILQHGFGDEHNDYGRGFYCTQDIELAKEWANRSTDSGFANKYAFDGRGLNVLDLTNGQYDVLNWLAILFHFRKVSAADKALYRKRFEFLEKHFYIDVPRYDVVVGYRADDAYFKFPMLFIQNELSVDRLREIYSLGDLGTQIALISEKSFSRLRFLEAIPVESIYRDHYFKRKTQADSRFEQIRLEEINLGKKKIEELMKEYDPRQ